MLFVPVARVGEVGPRLCFQFDRWNAAPLVERVQEPILQSTCSRALQSQQKMVIDTLAEQMNFNIIPVREPPRSLQHEGRSFASSKMAASMADLDRRTWEHAVTCARHLSDDLRGEQS